MSSEQRARASEIIVAKVTRSDWFESSLNIACYLSTKDEVDTAAILQCAWRMKKRIFAPVLKKNNVMVFREMTANSSVKTNFYGLTEPVDGTIIQPHMLDVSITPVVAYDSAGHRIGMGGGYFDRAFSFLRDRKHPSDPKLVGIAFACQQVDKITPNPWDIPLFTTISEKE